MSNVIDGSFVIGGWLIYCMDTLVKERVHGPKGRGEWYDIAELRTQYILNSLNC